MKDSLFAELLESASEALAHAKGQRNLKTTVLPQPPQPMSGRDVKDLRSRLDASQAVFASYLNVSTKLVQAWEADRRTPDGAALRLLRLADKAPELLLSGTAPARPRPNRRVRASEPTLRRASKTKSA